MTCPADTPYDVTRLHRRESTFHGQHFKLIQANAVYLTSRQSPRLRVGETTIAFFKH